ncbi:hypothetical protein [Ornithinicoccus halotolerans]|uniref:hypothetical protein n=1 Tax=Ornithinicoccus halotolerans TaxID=1748220 RepID=UPI001297A2AB|nr:hypothetical protein [Ornithinicoccus halotolerans]
MTEFLVVVPRAPRRQSDPRRTTDRAHALLRQLDTAYQSFAGPSREGAQLRTDVSPEGAAHLLYWSTKGGEPAYTHDRQQWVVQAGSGSAQQLLRSLAVQGGRHRYTSPVWGQYAVVLGAKHVDRVTAWNTSPALEAVHYTSDEENHYISNRPLLAALARARGNLHGAVLSAEYLSEYLLYGYAISGQTPFENVWTLPADRALCITAGQLALEEVPPGLTAPLATDHTLEEAGEALADAADHALERILANVAPRGIQLRLSGGKDSRLLLGLLRKRDLPVRAVTYGVASDAEVRLSQALASMADVPHRVTAPPSAAGTTLSGQVASTLRECGGIPPSEAHVAKYAGSVATSPQEGVMLGQWPLYKGGIAKAMRYRAGAVLQTLIGQGAPILRTAVREPFDAAMEEWYSSVHSASELEKLYLFARHFRSGRYLHSHIAHYARDALVAYPVSDAEITGVCDVMTMYEKVSEKALFLALRRIWPESLRLPLHDSNWRFEASGADPELSGADYELRSRPVAPAAAARPAKRAPGGDGEYSARTVNALARSLVASAHWDRLSSLLNTHTAESIVASSQHEDGWHFDHAVAKAPPEYAKYVWRLFVADAWWSRQWLR